MKTFLLIDDHTIVRASVKVMLSDIYADCTVDECKDTQSAEKQLRLFSEYDLIILDVLMPTASGNSLELMRYLSGHYPHTKVLIFSMAAEGVYAKVYFQAGAVGYASKDADVEEIMKAIATTLNNKNYISEAIAELILQDCWHVDAQNPFDTLSVREQQVCSLLVKGDQVTEIARVHNIDTSSVATYQSRVFKKLRIKNVVELIELARLYKVA